MFRWKYNKKRLAKHKYVAHIINAKKVQSTLYKCTLYKYIHYVHPSQIYSLAQFQAYIISNYFALYKCTPSLNTLF